MRATLKTRITFFFLIVGIIPALLITYLSMQSMEKSLNNLSYSNIISVHQIKQRNVENYFRNKIELSLMASSNPSIQAALQELLTARAAGPLAWYNAQKKSDTVLRSLKTAYECYDLIFLDLKGTVIYSLEQKENLSGINLTSIKGLSNIIKNSIPGIFVQDYVLLPQIGYTPCLFICSPVSSGQKISGILCAIMTPGEINRPVQEGEIYRDSVQSSGITQAGANVGEIYLIGNDKKMRSDSFLDPEYHSVAASLAGNLKENGVDTDPAESIAAYGRSSTKETKNYLGIDVISSYSPLNIPMLKWGIITEIDKKNAFPFLDSTKFLILQIIIASAALILFIAVILSKSIIKPINKVINDLIPLSQNVSNASTLVEKSSKMLAESASDQAASLEETSASLEQLSSGVDANAESAKNADIMTSKTQDLVNDISDRTKKTLDAINKIKKTSDETAEIIATINEISFQTNLLAVNASIEARKAGEAGRGFAAVAEEIRILAERSSVAAKNTKKLVDEVKQSVESGVMISLPANDSLKKISETTTQLKTITENVSHSSLEQASGISQISSLVSEMDRMTQKISISSQLSSDESKQLAIQVNTLNKTVDLLSEITGTNNILQKKSLFLSAAGNRFSHILSFFKKTKEKKND
ncbi:MAG: hypothetical protein JXR81_05875 [Candidatus Goldbacteria bacterium]|nr:hypothetical protein [Candidatus Goldiibacteriota bacterium]